MMTFAFENLDFYSWLKSLSWFKLASFTKVFEHLGLPKFQVDIQTDLCR
jgi:hypothetical protein